MIKLPTKDLTINPNNPRIIKDEKFKQLVKSVKNSPWMLELRPVIVNKDMVVIGGNMRLKAAIEAGFKEVPVVIANELTEEEQREFIIKDNLGYGEWDWLELDKWDSIDLTDWGLEMPTIEISKDLDYSLLDEKDISQQLEQMTSNVKKAIQIEFEHEHYEQANELIKFWREQGLYIGGFLMEKLKAEKDNL